MNRCVFQSVWLGLAWLGCAFAAVATEPARAVKAQPVAEGVYFVQGEAAVGSSANRNFISNAGFVVTDDGVVVIDALGAPALAVELIAEIRRITSRPVRYVIVTHYHADHIYGLQVFKAAGATVIAHANGKEYLHSDGAQRRLLSSRQEVAPWVDAQTQLVGADRWLTSAESLLRVGSLDFVLRHVGPAHTAEDLVVFVPQRGVLFAGDLVFRGRIPFVGEADSRQWIASLQTLMDFKPAFIVPGHGPVSEAPLADLQLTRDYLEHLRKTMAAAAANLEPFELAYAKADWSRFQHLPLFRAANRMNAFNTYLLLEQQGGK